MAAKIPKVAEASRLRGSQDQRRDASATLSPAPKGRNIPAQGKALGHRPTTNPRPEADRGGDRPPGFPGNAEGVINGNKRAAQGWAFVRLSEAGAISGGLTKNSKRDSNELQVSYLRVGNVYQNELRLDEIKTIGLTEREFAKTRLEKGDLLIVEGNGSKDQIGRLAIWDGSVEPCVHQNHLIRVRLSERVLPKFAVYWFSSQEGRARIEHVASSTSGLYTLSVSKIASLELPLPPLPEQRRIVARIEELFSRLDAGVAALRHARAQLQRYRQSVLAAAVTGELTREWREQNAAEASRLSSSDKDQRQDASATLLTEPADALLERILKLRREMWDGRGKYKEPVEPNDAFDRSPPSNWQIASMDALTCHITSGSRDWTKYYTDDGYAVFVMAQNVRPLKFHSTPVVRVAPPDGDRDKARSKVAENDLLITIVGANTGDVCRVDKGFDDYYVCQSVALLRPVESATANYLELYMNSEEHGQDQFEKWMYGQGRPHLSFDQLRSTAVFLPPLAEQHQIVAEVEARTTAIDHLEAELDRQITRSNRLRQSALAAAFSGILH